MRTAPSRAAAATIGTAVARMLRAERRARAVSCDDVPLSAAAISGRDAVVGAERADPALSASTRPRARRRSRGRGRVAAPLASRCPARSRAPAEQLGRGRRDDVRLAARLGPDLGVDAVAQAERQRDAERDDRQQQHVGERQQQAERAGLRRHSSGAVKRKPTPRTVWM